MVRDEKSTDRAPWSCRYVTCGTTKTVRSQCVEAAVAIGFAATHRNEILILWVREYIPNTQENSNDPPKRKSLTTTE